VVKIDILTLLTFEWFTLERFQHDIYTSMGHSQSFYKVHFKSAKIFLRLGSGAGWVEPKKELGRLPPTTPNFFPDLFLTQRI